MNCFGLLTFEAPKLFARALQVAIKSADTDFCFLQFVDQVSGTLDVIDVSCRRAPS